MLLPNILGFRVYGFRVLGAVFNIRGGEVSNVSMGDFLPRTA